MTPTTPDPTGERLAFSLLVAFFAGYGWFTLWQGGTTLKGRSGARVFADGHAGVAIAAVAFVLATASAGLLMRSLKAGRMTHALGFAFILVPPIAFVLLAR